MEVVKTEKPTTIQDENGHSYYLIDPTSAALNVNDGIRCFQTGEPISTTLDDTETQENSRATWTNSAIKRLLAAYKTHQPLFSTALKSDKVWEKIAESCVEWGFNVNRNQCRDKLSAMKQKYTRIKRKNSANTSGGRAIKFNWMKEFDDLFGNEYGKSETAPPDNSSESSSSESKTQPPVKKKKTTSEQILSYLKNDEKVRERFRAEKLKMMENEAKKTEKFRAEFLKIQRENNDILARLLQKL